MGRGVAGAEARAGGVVNELRAEFDEAALMPRHWRVALRKLADASGAPHSQLIGIGGGSAVLFNWVSEGSGEKLHAIDYPAIYDPRLNYRLIAGTRSSEGQLVDERDYAGLIEKLPSREHVDFVEREGVRHGVQTNLCLVEGGLVGMATLRPDPTTEEQRALFAELIPHAQTAVRIQAALEHQGAQLVAGTFEAMNIAAFVLDAFGALRGMTPEAESLLESAGPFKLRGERVGAADPADDRRLKKAIDASLGRGANVSAYRSIVLRGEDGAPRVIDLVILPAREGALQLRPRLVLVVRGGGARSSPSALLRTAFGLTGVEAQIAKRIATGMSRADVAEERKVSEHTVRAHLKSIFGKIGVSREAHLIAKLRDLLG